MKEVNNMRVLVFSPHADDAEVGMGGTINRLVREGNEVIIITAIIPCENEHGAVIKGAKEKRLKEAKNAAQILGAELIVLDIDPYDFTFNRFYCKRFDKIVREYKPDEIYMTWEHDSHQDHKTLANIMYSATRKNRCSLYMYETMLPGGITSYSFKSQLFVNISETINNKIESIKAYSSMMNIYEQWLDAIIGRAKYRGRQVGMRFAEAFEIVKEIR